MPIKLISQSHCEPSGSLATDKHSIGSTNEAFLAGSARSLWIALRAHVRLQQDEMELFAHPLFITKSSSAVLRPQYRSYREQARGVDYTKQHWLDELRRDSDPWGRLLWLSFLHNPIAYR
jgi:hypothetical protein